VDENLKQMAKRIRNWFKGRKEGPFKVDIFPTERCNLKCRFCNYPNVPHQNPERIEHELEDERIFRLIEEASELGTKVFGILGGEPFLRKSIYEILAKIKELGMAGSIVTNATLFTSKGIKKMVEIEWDLIRFSIDGLELTHDYLRGMRGSFKSAIWAIRRFSEWKGKLRKSKPTLELNFVLTRRNFKELPSLIRLVSRLGCEHVYVLPMISLTSECERLKITSQHKEVLDYLRRALQTVSTLGIGSNIKRIIQQELAEKADEMHEVILPKSKLKDPYYIPCFAAWYAMNVDVVGIVTPCAQFSPANGVSLRERSLKEIWFGEKFEEIRKRFRNKDLPACCSRCCVPLVEENQLLREMLKIDL
jgi:MoaA/NifB/PqqE/SkfB family radical SAM enzyme